MPQELSESISQLKKKKWVNLHGLITCATEALGELTCTSMSFLGRGSYNTVYKLSFSSGTQVAASVSNNDEEDFNPESKRSEIEAMRFVRESGLYPDVPVPKVYAWDTTFKNPAGAPYVLMDIVEGVTLQDLRDDKGLRGLDTLPYSQQLSIVKALARLQALLSKPTTFDEIGSITSNEKGEHVVGPLMSLTERSLGGPYKSMVELWRAQLEDQIMYALQEWSGIERDNVSQSLSEPFCTPQTFAELFQKMASLIPHFNPPKSCLPLVLHHPDLALRNIFFDKLSISSGKPRITGVIDWSGTQILPLILSAKFPDDLITTGDDPCERPGYPDENWRSVSCDWTSLGDTSQWPQAFRGPGEVVDHIPPAQAMVRRFYLRAYFSACFAEQLNLVHGDSNLAHATIFADAPYYLKFHEMVCNGWISWVEHASWIRETYWRLRLSSSGSGTESDALVIGPNVYRNAVEAAVRDLGIFEEAPHLDSDEEDQ